MRFDSAIWASKLTALVVKSLSVTTIFFVLGSSFFEDFITTKYTYNYFFFFNLSRILIVVIVGHPSFCVSCWARFVAHVLLGPAFGRTDFSRIFIFEPPDFFADFLAGFFLLTFVGYSAQKNPPGKSPAKFSKIYTTKILQHISADCPGQVLRVFSLARNAEEVGAEA